MAFVKPRSLFEYEDDGLIKRLDFSDEELDLSPEFHATDISPILRSSSDEERMNSSTDSVIAKSPRLKSCSTPPYRKVRALRLFGSPQSPKTLLKQSELCSVEKNRLTVPRILFSRDNTAVDRNHNTLRGNRCFIPYRSSPKLETNINPFFSADVYLGKRRRDSGICGSSFHDSLDKISDNESENEFQPNKRLRLSRYEKEFLEINQIGSGEFGSVYKCVNRLDGCVYAIKKSRKPMKGTSNERTALNEVYAHAVLGYHKHVVRYYSAWAENDHMLIQFEYCNGGSLLQALEEKARQNLRFPESEVKRILLHVALGLKYIHSLNLVHMDIKPGNIFISVKPQQLPHSPTSSDDGFEDGDFVDEEFVYKIGDLGHVTSVTSPAVEEGDCRYLPAELLQDDYSALPKADIFALGLTIYEVCGGGSLPKNGEQWHAIRDGKLPYLSYYSKELNDLIRQMVDRNPDVRPSSAALVQNATLVPYVRKSKEQIIRELNAEKFKNQILSSENQLLRQLQNSACKPTKKSSREKRLIGGKTNRSSSVTF